VTITLLTFLIIQRIDDPEGDVRFYLNSLPLPYYLSLIGTFSFAILCKKRALSLFSSIFFSFLTIYTPYSLYATPWFQDIYYYLGEALSVASKGQFGSAGHSHVTPGISLFSGSYLLITKMDPFVFSKIYVGLVVVLINLIFYSIAKKLGASNPSIAPLIFFSICWQDELHLCRLSFSIFFYLTFLLLTLPNQKKSISKTTYADLFTSLLIIPPLVFSHPSTPLFPVLGFICAIVISKIPILIFHKYHTTSLIQKNLGKIIVLALTWLTWNLSVPGMGGVQTFTSITQRIIEAFIYSPLETPQSTALKLSSVTYTNEYYIIIQMKLAHWIIIFFIGILISLIYRFYRNFTAILIISLFLFSQSTFLVSYFSDLSFTSRPSFYVYLIFPLIITIAISSHLFEGLTSINDYKRSILRLFIISFLFLSALSLPVLNHSDTPFLYVPTQEHASEIFAIKYLPGVLPVMSTLPNGPGPFYSRLNQRERGLGSGIGASWYNLVRNETRINSILYNAVVLFSGISSKRDAYWKYNPSYSDSLNRLKTYLERTHSKVYEAEDIANIFVPKS